MRVILKYVLLVILHHNFSTIKAIWPPAYKVNLSYQEEFVLGDKNYFENDEMIDEKEIEKFNFQRDSIMFDSLHQHVKRYDKKDDNSFVNDDKLNNDTALDDTDMYGDNSDDPEPFEAGFANENSSEIDKSKGYIHFDNKLKLLVEENVNNTRKKKEDTNDYNYDELNKEYQAEVERQKNLNDTFDSSLFKSEDDLEKSKIQKLWGDFKSMPRNCTKDDLKGIGVGAVKCFWLERKTPKNKKEKMEYFKFIGHFIKIWFYIYLAFVIPCWCQKGWCCCCFRCKFCRPRMRIDEAKKYLMNYPPGQYLDENKKTITYEPNIYEIHAYEKLKKELLKI